MCLHVCIMFTNQEIAQVYAAEIRAPGYVLENGHSHIKLVDLRLKRVKSNGKATDRRTPAKSSSRSAPG